MRRGLGEVNKKKLILYFGLAGVLLVAFLRTKEAIEFGFKPLSTGFFIDLIVNMIISYSITATISAVVLILPINWIEKNLPWTRNIWRRFFADLLITPIFAMMAMYVIYHLLTITNLIDHSQGNYMITLQDHMEVAVVMDVLLVTVYEGIVLFGLWKDSIIRSERLEKENMVTRFEALKNQINPHFLFNSLNTLSSLVHEDVQKSEEFIDEFSNIYRYILDRQDKMVSSVAEEIEFIKSFFHLLKIRFGEALITDIKVEQEKLDYFIPTLSLQLLVENAIKHNRITKTQPLTIRIKVEDDFLIVTNNFQPRSEVTTSTKVGLNNLKERYAILCDVLTPAFLIDGDEYVAKIPLIEME